MIVSTLIQPRSWYEINRLINRFSSMRHISPDETFVLLVNIRMYLETNQNKDYKTIEFYANMLVHEKLDCRNNYLPLQYFAKMIKDMENNEIKYIGVDALNWSIFMSELEKFLINYNFPNSFLNDSGLHDEFAASVLSLIWGKEFSCIKDIYNVDGSINDNNVDRFGVRLKSGIIQSFSTTRFITSTGLAVYRYNYRIDKGDKFQPVIIYGPIDLGRCDECNFPYVSKTTHPKKFVCSKCGKLHLIDNEVYY